MSDGPAGDVSLEQLLASSGLNPDDLPPREPFREAQVLVQVGPDCFGREAQLAPPAANAWHRMRDAALRDDVEILLVSAFRSCRYQAGLWERKLRAGSSVAEIRRVLGVPGFSQHHTGCAVDVGAPGCTDLTEAFEHTRAFHWLSEHAGAFGFVLSYPRNNALGVAYEPWHWFLTETG